MDKKYNYLAEDITNSKILLLDYDYGLFGGFFSTTKGTDYELLDLPYDKKTIEYHEYKVTNDLRVECVVKKGIVAPMFSSPGGGVQFKHKQPIFLECEDGYLQEDFSWIQKNI